MKCGRCDSTLRAFVMIGMYVDADDMNTISKNQIRKKETHLSMKDPTKDEIFCPKCGDEWTRKERTD